MNEVVVDGQRYVPANEEARAEIERRLQTLTLEGEDYWRELFIKNDTGPDGKLLGMYEEGDETAPFFTEAFLYNLLGKDDARSVLSVVRMLCEAAGVEQP